MNIKILHLEDDMLDAELIQVEIQQSIPESECFTVSTKTHFEAFLRTESVDIVLSDYQLPQYDGISALSHVIESYPYIPFIFVSGAMGEELAVKSLKSGASDYILKSSIVRLPSAIERTIREYRYKQQYFELSNTQKQLENQLLQSQKLEIIGTLTASLAHDVKNFFLGIRGFAEIINLQLKSTNNITVIQKSSDNILNIVDHGSKMVEQILNFTYANEEDCEHIKLSKLIEEVHEFLTSTLPSNIKIQVYIPKKNIVSYCNPSKIFQVLMNLCTNAIHAMQDQNGQLTISLLNAESGSLPEGLPKAQEFALIKVEDNGVGISPEKLELIFRPFYTSKPKGVGTGLGLSISQGVIQEHLGLLTVESTVGLGTTFHIYLPITEKKDVVLKSFKAQSGKRVYVVDDDLESMNEKTAYLQKLGYQTVSFSHPLSLLKAVEHGEIDCDLIITDNIMPMMNGNELCIRLKSWFPELKIVLVTGYEGPIHHSNYKEFLFDGYVKKAEGLVMLSQVVYRVLFEETQ